MLVEDLLEEWSKALFEYQQNPNDQNIYKYLLDIEESLKEYNIDMEGCR